jgi:hypothetical protein
MELVTKADGCAWYVDPETLPETRERVEKAIEVAGKTKVDIHIESTPHNQYPTLEAAIKASTCEVIVIEDTDRSCRYYAA